ncbi:hypothetical protein ACQ4PT_042840 [Festuca glaucescens]
MILKGYGSVGDKIAVGMATHDYSLGGFANGRGHWQSFPGHDHLFPSSTPLPFRNSYDDLVGGLANLPDVPLGQEALKQAARVLSAHDPATATDHRPLKRALASLKVMLSEAQRLQPIHETVSRGWESGARVNPDYLPYIQHWYTMSYEIIRANRTGPSPTCWRRAPTSAAWTRRSPWSSLLASVCTSHSARNLKFSQLNSKKC